MVVESKFSDRHWLSLALAKPNNKWSCSERLYSGSETSKNTDNWNSTFRYKKINASQTCEFLLSSLKKSNLNFQLSESPFSVSIQIRKIVIRDQMVLFSHLVYRASQKILCIADSI